MKTFNLLAVKVMLLAAAFALTSCSDATILSENDAVKSESAAPVKIELDVYKSRTCGCCKKWIDHVEADGFDTNVNNITFLDDLKEKKGIAPNYRSCHTAESQDGYIFEGHVPAKYIKQYLSDIPKGTIGLSVPGMPVGSPGMEMGKRFMPYQILLLNTDGTSSVYAEVATYEEQF
jgi:hypothetical protein